MRKLNIAYFGTPSFSALFLEKLITDISINRLIEIKFVVTQPDRKVGRKQILTQTPVKQIAIKYNIPVFENLKSQISNLKIKSQNLNLNKKISDLGCGFDICDLSFNIDFALVFAFGEIIPKELLNLPRYGFINIHPSLLPKYRGPSPIAYPLINGDTVTGVTLIKMDEQIDHGPIIAQEKLNILPNDRRPDLEIKLTDLAFKMFKKLFRTETKAKAKTHVFRDLGGAQSPLSGPSTPTEQKNMTSSLLQAPPIPQNHKLATYTKLLKKSDGFIEFENLKLKIKNSPKTVFNLFRGLYPWPGIWTIIEPRRLNKTDVKRLKITDLEFINNELRIKKVQLEGKKEVDFKIFIKAYGNL